MAFKLPFKFKIDLKALIKFSRQAVNQKSLDLRLIAACHDRAADKNLAKIKSLLDQGAKPNAGHSKKKPRAIAGAVAMGNWPAVRLLLERGADPNSFAADNMRSLLSYSIEFKKPELFDILLDFKVDVNKKDRLGHAPLVTACALRMKKMRDRLIAAGANPNATDHKNVEVIFYEIYNNDLKTVQALLTAGAKLEVHNSEGQSPIDLARRLRFNDILKALEMHEEKQLKPWRVLDDDRLVQVEILREAGYRVTRVFNTKTGKCTILSRNIKTNVEGVAEVDIDEKIQKPELEKIRQTLKAG